VTRARGTPRLHVGQVAALGRALRRNYLP